jgi:outer membrane protein assembly factor BamD
MSTKVFMNSKTNDPRVPKFSPTVFRITAALMVGAALFSGAACSSKKVKNPIAQVDSKQPDKVLFDRAMTAMKQRKYDVARITLQTLINTYPDSEYIARAKLSIGDSWYAEGGSTAWAQAESEYKDFETFFPNMPEAAEAQLKIADIHYEQIEKPDRDYTHAKRAEDEYRQLLTQYPDSKLADKARVRLLQVQEVLAEREYRIGRFYYLRGSWMAATARLKTLTDTYPLYSHADEALYMLGQCYEQQVDIMRRARATDSLKNKLIKKDVDAAAEAYSKIVTRYPAMPRYNDARARLAALERPVPTPTPEAVEQNKREMASRGETGRWGRVMLNMHRHPDFASATKVGDPVLIDPPKTDAAQLVRGVNEAVKEDIEAHKPGTQGVKVEQLANGELAPNQAPPRSESANADSATPATADPSASGAAQPATADPAPAANGQPDSKPADNTASSSSSTNPDAPAEAPAQVNEAANRQTPNVGAKPPEDDKNVSTSKKKKKKFGIF